MDDATLGGRIRLVFDDSTMKILGGGLGDVVGEIRVNGGQALVQALSGFHHVRDCPCVRANHGRLVAAIIQGKPHNKPDEETAALIEKLRALLEQTEPILAPTA